MNKKGGKKKDRGKRKEGQRRVDYHTSIIIDQPAEVSSQLIYYPSHAHLYTGPHALFGIVPS